MEIPTLEGLAAEAEGLRFRSFDSRTAWSLGSLIRERAAARGLPVAIEISLAGHLLFMSALEGTSPDNAEWLRRKRNTVMRFHRASLAMRLLCEAKGTTLGARYGLDERDFAASGGGVPIVLEGSGCVGAAVVSGLPDTEDHRLVVEAMRTLIAETGAA